MLISKKTWCFACENGQLTRSPVTKDSVFFLDSCDTCDSIKTTHIETGVVAYERKKDLSK